MLRSTRRLIRSSPGVVGLLSHLIPHYRWLAVKPDTDIVIEGYPGCANTFSVVAFEISQPAPVKIAHHLHSLGQIRRALNLNIPCLILLRHPRDAILSLATRTGILQFKMRLTEYVNFYTGIREISNPLVIADFNQVTRDFGSVIERVNQRFGTDFSLFNHSPENIKFCYEQIDMFNRANSRHGELDTVQTGRPTETRGALIATLKKQLVKHDKSMERALDLYHYLLAKAEQ